jgi:hypothetical protein
MFAAHSALNGKQENTRRLPGYTAFVAGQAGTVIESRYNKGNYEAYNRKSPARASQKPIWRLTTASS